MMESMIDPDAWFIVVNPASGAGRAQRFAPRLVAALERARVRFHCEHSTAPRDAERRFTGAAAGGWRRFLGIGGDGTLNELVNGVIASGVPLARCLVAIAAGGTGNDWSSSLAIPVDPDRLAACMGQARARPVDLGIARMADGRSLAFHNVAGAGIDAEAIRRTPRRGPRSAAYLLGLARTLATWRAARFEIVADGQPIAGRFLLALVSIGPRCGGGMRLTPEAAIDDGWLDLLTVDPLPLMGAIARLPKLFDGRLAGDAAFRVTRCREATISAAPPCSVELDGELIGTTPFTVKVEPGALNALDCRLVTRGGGVLASKLVSSGGVCERGTPPDPARDRPAL